MLKKLLVTCLAATSISVVSVAANAQQYATALFDKTGSMTTVRPADGKTRCEFGKNLFLKTVATGITRADFLNVKAFGSSSDIESLTNGFIDVTGLNQYIGQGKIIYDDIAQQINAMPCNASSTSLGDALCESIDELQAQNATGRRRLGLVTDAGENSSQVCGGRNDYVQNHIMPKLVSPPPVTLNVAILARGGNVSARAAAKNSAQSLENVPANQRSSAVSTKSLSEIDALKAAAQLSGGGAIVIGDNVNCTSNCDPASQEPPSDDWGDGW